MPGALRSGAEKACKGQVARVAHSMGNPKKKTYAWHETDLSTDRYSQAPWLHIKWPANSRRPVVKRGFETCPLHSMCIQASGRFLRAQHVDTTRRQSPLFDASPLVPVYGTPWRCRGGGAHSSPSRGRGRNALECTTCAPALSLAAASAACSGKSMGAKT